MQGTTGGDREKLFADVQAGGGYAVIAPNMAKQIVALQVRRGWGWGCWDLMGMDGCIRGQR